jgi:hypothetical protein
MAQCFTIILLLLAVSVFGQNQNCFCDKDTFMNHATVSCDTTIFANQSRLYWQYNCNRIWLTLENAEEQKYEIDTVPIVYYGYTYRLGFHLIKEFDQTILFRSGCPANGPCIYTLIDKFNGKTVEKFGQLIGIDTDIQWENAHEYDFNFIVYLSGNYDRLTVYFVDSGEEIEVPFKEELTYLIPENQFDDMTLKNNILTLAYHLENNKKKTLKINLNNKKNRR